MEWLRISPPRARAVPMNAPKAASSSDNDRCKYRGKPCTNTRALRVDGTPHHLCDEHRRRANRNQRRSQLRIRLRKQLQEMREKSLEASTFQVFWDSMEKQQASAALTDQQLFRLICTADMDPPSVPPDVTSSSTDEDEKFLVEFLSPLMLEAPYPLCDNNVESAIVDVDTTEEMWALLNAEVDF